MDNEKRENIRNKMREDVMPTIKRRVKLGRING
jgi:hypothetical protein